LCFLEADTPGKSGRIVPFVGAAGDEHLRDPLCIEIFLDGTLRGGSERTKQKKYVVAFDQLSGLFNSLGWTVGIIVRNEIDLTSVDASGFIYHAKISLLRTPNDAVCGNGTTVRHSIADFYFLIGDPGVIALSECGASSKGRND
jgi:hypothetical protein